MTSPLHIAILTRLSDGPADVAQLARDCGDIDPEIIRDTLAHLEARGEVHLAMSSAIRTDFNGRSRKRRALVARLTALSRPWRQLNYSQRMLMRCSRCAFYAHKEPPGGGYCLRYPKITDTSRENFCGEFVELVDDVTKGNEP